MFVVILAAGMGTRLGGDTPKPLTPIAAGRTLLSNQIDTLSALVGRDRIVLVLGHEAERIMQAHPDMMYVYNAWYAETNTAKSLLCGMRRLEGDVLWTNADLYFEAASARRIVEGRGTRLLVNRARVAEEEIKYTVRDDGSIAELSKTVRGGLGEALGMNVVAGEDLARFVAALEAVGDQDYFEKALERCTLARTIRATPVPIGEGDYCREVDYPEDLEAVRSHLAQAGAS